MVGRGRDGGNGREPGVVVSGGSPGGWKKTHSNGARWGMRARSIA